MIKRTAIALLALGLSLAVVSSASAAEFGIKPGTLHAVAENEDGTVDRQASSHPYAFTLGFELNTDSEGNSVGGQLRDVLISLPPGMVGYPFAVPRCTRQEFEGASPKCSPNSQVGVIHANLPEAGFVASGPIYNMVPPPGVAAQLGFSVYGLNALQSLSVRSEAGYGVLSTTTGVPLEVTSVEATIWGTPADPTHDARRGPLAAEGVGEPGGNPYVGAHLPFLTLPATCVAPLQTTVEVDSKLDPGNFVSGTVYSTDSGGAPAPLLGCGAVPFSPRLTARPTSAAATSPAGLDFDLAQPNEGLLDPPVTEGGEVGPIVETETKKLELTLPQGVVPDASIADGLAACTEAQIGYTRTDAEGPHFSEAPQSCPEASKLGTITAQTPLLDHPLSGSVYLAAQGSGNPFGTLLALYIAIEDPASGVVIKQAGRVDLDPNTGQLTTTVDGMPPIPYSGLQLRLRGGSRGPLTTPVTCGTFQATARLYPFSDPGEATVRNLPFTISSGAEGGGCVSGESQLPNSPGFEAGTQTPLAGEYSPLVFKVSRGNRSQKISRIDTTLPEGLTGKLAGLTSCSDAQIAQAASRSNPGEGQAERDNPSCPDSSKFGTATVGAGSGTPFHVTGNGYLAGPYKGAPLSFAFITPAIAGPFDLGTVVVRAPAYVDPATAQITVNSDAIPTILHGVPLDVRSIAIDADRSGFTLNPTSCAPMSIGGQAISTLGGAATLSNRFQVGGCKGLDYEPHLKLFLKGATKRTGHPKLIGTVFAGPGEAGTARLQVKLPRSAFLDQAHIRTVCTRVQFAAGNGHGEKCPKGAVYGKAWVKSPLLGYWLSGPVLLRSSNHKLPDLVMALSGPPSQPVKVELHGKTDSVKGALRNTFEAIPDAPLTKARLVLFGGKRGLVVNSRNLCGGTQRANVRAKGQNNAIQQLHPIVHNQCGNKHKKKSKRHARRARRR